MYLLYTSDEQVINLIKRLLVAVPLFTGYTNAVLHNIEGCDQTQKIKCRKILAITNTIKLGGELRPPGNELHD